MMFACSGLFLPGLKTPVWSQVLDSFWSERICILLQVEVLKGLACPGSNFNKRKKAYKNMVFL